MPLGTTWAALFVIITKDLHLIGSKAWGGRGPLHLSSRLCQMNEIKVLELSRPGENQTCKDLVHDHYHHHCFTCNMFNSAILVCVQSCEASHQFFTTTLWEACSTPIHQVSSIALFWPHRYFWQRKPTCSTEREEECFV